MSISYLSGVGYLHTYDGEFDVWPNPTVLQTGGCQYKILSSDLAWQYNWIKKRWMAKIDERKKNLTFGLNGRLYQASSTESLGFHCVRLQ